MCVRVCMRVCMHVCVRVFVCVCVCARMCAQRQPHISITQDAIHDNQAPILIQQ